MRPSRLLFMAISASLFAFILAGCGEARQADASLGQTLTVADAPPAPSPPQGGSGEAMPVGDLPGWHQVFMDDFSNPLAAGQFPGPYSAKWTAYNGFYDAAHVGYYDQRAISVHDGFLDL